MAGWCDGPRNGLSCEVVHVCLTRTFAHAVTFYFLSLFHGFDSLAYLTSPLVPYVSRPPVVPPSYLLELLALLVGRTTRLPALRLFTTDPRPPIAPVTLFLSFFYFFFFFFLNLFSSSLFHWAHYRRCTIGLYNIYRTTKRCSRFTLTRESSSFFFFFCIVREEPYGLWHSKETRESRWQR